MKKAFFWIIIMIVAIIVGFVLGTTVFKTENSNNANVVNTNTSPDINIVNNNNIDIETAIQEEKIGVNTKIIQEIYYSDCDHIILDTVSNNAKYVNLTKKDLESKYPEWEIKEFSKEQVVLYREEKDFCNEHFLVKDEDGYVTTYTLNNEGEILEILDKTDIATEYLTQIDKTNLQNGIRVYTKQNLNKLLEDFE